MISVLEIPGFIEAVQRENFLRDAAFLPLTENINGFEVRQMTLNDYNKLRIGHSPLLPPFWTTTPADLAAFLWLLSLEYSSDLKKRGKFLKRCSFMPSRPPLLGLFGRRRRWARKYVKSIQTFQKTLAAAREYVKETLLDRPPQTESSGYQPRFFSDITSICCDLSEYYGGGPMIYQDHPMRLIFQMLNKIRADNSERGKALLCNPLSEGVVAKFNQRN